MSTFITIMGWLCIAFILLAVLCGAVGLACMGIARVLDGFERHVVATTRHELGRDITSCSHWFGESKEAWIAINILGERLTKGLSTDVARWREEWHERLREQGK